jgi:hypothetical protein
MFPASCRFSTADRPYSGGGKFLARSTIALGPNFFKTFRFRHAFFAQLDTFLQAAANFLSVPQYLRVTSFVSPRRSAAAFCPYAASLVICQFPLLHVP